jgi:ubiquinone/menaquinone biosynthesis C-methylase UbiE
VLDRLKSLLGAKSPRRRLALPEEYWQLRGEDVVGNQTRAEMLSNRQIETYRAICALVKQIGADEIADLGCNVGVLGVLLRESGYRGTYVGVDANANALRLAERNLGAYEDGFRLVESNLRAMDCPEERYPVTVLKDVLEHMEDFQPILGEALRVTSGYALVANFIPWTEGEPIVSRTSEGYYHNLYSRSQVYAFAASKGFEVASVTSAMERDARPNEIVSMRRR